MRLIHRATGIVIGEGVGSANTYESRYRWRWFSEKDLPKDVIKEDLVSKEKTGKYGAYVQYRMDNDDMFSIWNTVLKMAKKRALVDVTLAATRSSGIFAQTEKELEAYLNGEDPEAEPENTQSPPSTNTRQAPPPSNARSNPPVGATGTITPVNKNRVLKLMKEAALDFNGVAAEATKALNRPIKKVMDDLKTDADWIAVGDHLEFFIANKDIDFNDLPSDMS